MHKYKIGIIIGSLRKDSINRKLAEALIPLAPRLDFKIFPIGDLPLYNQDHDDNPADTVKRLKSAITSVDGILFVTPEYNRSIPGVLKNALDHASRPYGQNAWAGKPAGILGCSIGAAGTALAQQHLRNIVSYLDMPTMSQPEAYLHIKEDFFTPDGQIGPNSKKFIQDWLSKYADWVKNILPS
ncbi:MAG: NAD(P)H-dependent oxidoreductase [Gammaproteobacteria bacterium]|nr:NAD(P)H-dependent oxidoreductase [Gammaproteobacteria bacterium]